MTVGYLILATFNWQFKKDSDSSRVACIAVVVFSLFIYLCEPWIVFQIREGTLFYQHDTSAILSNIYFIKLQYCGSTGKR